MRRSTSAVLAGIVCIALVGSVPELSGEYRPFGRNQDCVCAELQGYLDYLGENPAIRVNQPLPAMYSQRSLQRRCKTTISVYELDKMLEAIRSYAYYCSEGKKRECDQSAQYIGKICPNISAAPLPPPPPKNRAECFYRCKATCKRAKDRHRDWGDLTTDPQCLKNCSQKCHEMFP